MSEVNLIISFLDWVCGGQWNRLATFLGQFVSSLATNNIELVVFFNGCSEQSRHHDWIQQQLKLRSNINQVRESMYIIYISDDSAS